MSGTRPGMPPGPDGATSAQMLTTLVRLRDALAQTSLPLDLPEVEERRTQRVELVDQLEDYVLPRLVQLDAPLLAVVGGSTGAGKSTLVNSLVGTQVTTPGVLRPTTRSPVLVHSTGDAEWFGQDRILPGLERTQRPTNDPGALQLVASSVLPPGLAVLDAPDVDSVEESNRVLAAELLAAADLWLFVTTAARYADQVPWDYLRRAADRSAAVAIVLDRTPPAAVAEVSSHLARMLTARGLRDSPLFVVREGHVDADGLLPPEDVVEIKNWLAALAADSGARGRVVRQTLEGTIRVLARSSHQVADAATEQVAIRGRLLRDVEQSYADALLAIDRGCADGTLLRGEVLARWQEFVGTGEFFKGLEAKVGWLRDRLGNAVRGKPQQAGRVSVAVESGLHTLILENAEDAAERAANAWHGVPAGRRLLEDGGQDLGRASRDFRGRADRAVRDWQQGVMDLVRSEGAGKRTTARFLAYGVNGLGVALMVVVFASTAGLTGAEVGIAGGSALLGQKLLEAVFGDQAVRRLAQRAREDLAERVQVLLAEEQRRFTDRIDTLEISAESPELIRELARRVDDLRFAQKSAESAGTGHAVGFHEATPLTDFSREQDRGQG
ncbi:P-loop NTPase family protein [Nocardioides mangrovicus]|uniref:ABC transporter n=1 Tax=Nocardioides mangrovicus TaxID=2478913 RepID=UPI0018E09987|nr:ABC transporter [Nocardioides mangrovicus]